jgi:hypothetical protein
MAACPPHACGVFCLFLTPKDAKTGSERQEGRENPPDRTITHVFLHGFDQTTPHTTQADPPVFLTLDTLLARYRAFFIGEIRIA